jgi:hypothetical protein
MTVKIGFASTKVVNSVTVPDFTAEKTANNNTIGKMITLVNTILKNQKVKGVNNVVGTYDDDVVGEACFNIFHGAMHVDVYGNTIHRHHFEVAKIL